MGIVSNRKDVHREVESEGNGRKTLGLRDKKHIRGQLLLGKEAKKSNAIHW